MIQCAGSVSKSWLARELGVIFDRDYYFDVQKRHSTDRRCNQFVAETLCDLNAFYTESNLGRQQWYSSDQVLVGGIQPNMIIGMLLGADFLPAAGADADISPQCLAGRQFESLPAPNELLAHPLVCQWQRDIAELLDSPAGGMRPIPPFSWDCSGRAAVHGVVTSGLKFYGDGFLMNLLSEPESSQKLIGWLTDVTAQLVSHFSTVGRLPVSSIHVGECAACMLDESSFRRYVVPATSQLGERFGAVRFHSCGCSDHVLEACRAITGLASLDVGGETSVARIRDLFGPKFPVGIAPLVEDMQASTPQGILDWYRCVERDNEDGDLTIGFHLEADYHIENLRALSVAVRAASE